jgi:C-terminal processing protease CtpA/Prc
MHKNQRIALLTSIILLLSLSCQVASGLPGARTTATPSPAPTSTRLPLIPVAPGEANPQEPVFITGDIPYTSPFFLNTISQPYVLLEDQAGFIQRDREFVFPLQGQTIGPVVIHDDNTLTYSISLPAIPQGTQVDVDNDGIADPGVQVFALSYWSNTWGDPFLEKRDGRGWSSAYTSMVTDPERENEIVGGKIVVWSPDDKQSFPTGFGDDNLLFTQDDPTAPIPAGYTIVDLDQDPFQFYKEPTPNITLLEGDVAVNDYSSMSYTQAFETLFDKVSKEYPFTKEKGIDWEALNREFSTKVAAAGDSTEFYKALRSFAFSIPDAHINLKLDPKVLFEARGGGFGMVLSELSDGQVIVTQVIPNSPTDDAGIQTGAQIISWDGKPVSEAISAVVPDFGPYSTEHHKRLEQVAFLTRVPPETKVEVVYKNPGASEETVNLDSIIEYDSLFAAIPTFNSDPISPPVEGRLLEESGLGYIKVNTFSDDYNLLASSWEHYINSLNDNDVPGLIIDLRQNGGGSGELAADFAGYFFDQEIPLYDGYYYSEESGTFESDKNPSIINPAPILYKGPIAVLVSPYCVSACEGFAYALTQQDRSIIVGHYPTAGAFGEVGRGQYTLPDNLSMQFPTGRPLTPDGTLLIEGVGVVPDITVPVTEESALGKTDAVLQAAVEALLGKIQK